jgi:hypothetical protein
MNIRTVWMSAAVAALLAGPADAQLLGGRATGGLGGSLSSGLGNVGGTVGGTLDGSLRGSADAVSRTGELGSRAAGELEASTPEPVVKDEKPAKSRRATRESRRGAEQAAKPAAKPEPEAKAGGMADAGGGLSALDGEPAPGQAHAAVDANASIEK